MDNSPRLNCTLNSAGELSQSSLTQWASLYNAFYGKGDHRFYLNLGGLERGGDLEDCAFYKRAEDGDWLYASIEQQAKELVFPLARLFGITGGFSKWENEVLRVCGGDAGAIYDMQERLSALHDKWIEPIEEYEFPMVTLNAETTGAAVCMIFETLNRTGVRLSVFDLLTARFWPKEFNLREKWEEAQEDNPILKEFQIDPYYILQVINLLEPGVDKEGKVRAPSIKRGAILEMKVAQVQNGWERAIQGLTESFRMLRDECGVLEPGLLPYNTIVIPMAAAWATQAESKGILVGVNRLKILRWFWCSVFGQRYENAPNSQAAKDFAELQRWMGGSEPPESVCEFRLDINLRKVNPRQRAVYRGIMALILQNGALDFYKRGRITSQLLADKKNPVDDHHIFPRAYLDERGMPAALRDCILNRTFIDRETNKRLSSRSPSDYFCEIRTEQGARGADDLLKTHLLPVGVDSPLLVDDFETFLEWREQMLKEVINSLTQD